MFKTVILYGPFLVAALLRYVLGSGWLIFAMVLCIVPVGAVATVGTWLDPRALSDPLIGASYLGMAAISAAVGIIAGKLLRDGGQE
ncbi:hypothetical protein [Roseovarius sp. 2305UL8-3]|uniref:hypothetical protein n=1 Tax=Roseovarius conchicola TaxID=3121636 RepID=UPI0035281D84